MSKKSWFPPLRTPYGTDNDHRSSLPPLGYHYQYNPERLYHQATGHQDDGQYVRNNYAYPSVVHDRAYIDDVIRKEVHWLSNTMDSALKKIDSDVLKLCDDMKLRDKSLSDFSVGLSALEKHYTTAVEDLTSKIMAYSNLNQQIKSEIKFCQADLDKICQLHVKERDTLIGEIYKNKSDYVTELSKMRAELEERKILWNKDMNQLEGRMKTEQDAIKSKSSAIEGYVKTTIAAMKKSQESANASMDAKFTKQIAAESKLLKENMETQKKITFAGLSSLEEKITDLKVKTTEDITLIENRMKTLEDSIDFERKVHDEYKQAMDLKIKDLYERDLSKEVEKVQRQTEDGFSKIDEQLSALRTVVEGKYLLLEDQLKKEINRMEKMILQVSRSINRSNSNF